MARGVTASSPGKVILFGEHFVVKGSRALASAIGLRARVTVSDRGSWPMVIKSLNLGVEARVYRDLSYKGSERLRHIVRILEVLREMDYEILPVEAVIGSEIPPAAGLGSSAATSAAFALAYSAYHGDPLDYDRLSRVAYEGEVVVHGRPSGIDNNVVVYGGGLVYRKGDVPKRVDTRLPEGYYLVIANTGVPRDTGAVVKEVLELAERNWSVARLIYEAADSIIDQALDALARGDARRLGELMNISHGLLSAVGASSLEIERLVYEARAAGALGAKLTGAGRGGCIIALTGDPERLLERLRRVSVWVEVAELGVEGSMLED